MIHYNNFRTIYISLSYGKRYDLGSKWKINYEAGFNYSRMYFSTGRTVGLDYEIYEFDNDNTLFTRNHLGLFTGFGILYKYNDVISIGSDIFILQYLDNWSLESDVILQPTKLNFKIGVRYWL